MAERIVSPGVFTRENDLSFLPQGIGEIGAAFIGPLKQGPAFVPTVVTSPAEFEDIFGRVDGTYYTEYAVQNYLREAGTVTIVRVAGLGGYQQTAPIGIGIPTGSLAVGSSLQLETGQAVSSIFDDVPSTSRNGVGSGATFRISGSGGTVTDSDITVVNGGSGYVDGEIITIAGSVFGNTGNDIELTVLSTNIVDGKLITTLHSTEVGDEEVGFTTPNVSGKISEFSLTADLLESGSPTTLSSSLLPSDGNDVSDVLGESPLGSKRAYTYTYFENEVSKFETNQNVVAVTLPTQNFGYAAQPATTPWVKSQLISNERYDLFRFHTLGDGNVENRRFKVSISGVKAAGEDGGTDYSVFSVTIRSFSDTDKRKSVVETFSNVNLDPDSPNYIARVIGDRHITIDTSGKITENGDWRNNSKYVRVEVATQGSYPVSAVPFAHGAYTNPIYLESADAKIVPAVTFQTGSSQNTAGNPFRFSGIDLETTGVKIDNHQYLKPLPENAETGSNIDFAFDGGGVGLTYEATGSATNDMIKRQFTLAFQGGFDGQSPAVTKQLGSNITSGNSQGFDLSSSTANGSLAYSKAIAAISNADEWDINMVVTPGVIRSLHPSVVTEVTDMVEARQDAFYISDFAAVNDTIEQVTEQANSVDTNYVATYYPWVRTVDTNTNKLVSVPPSVLLPAVYAANDNIAAEWYAPAGLNRGGIVGAVSVVNRLTHEERDTLYENKVNPIAAFPGQGISAYGQKTLQDRPSALDRINVRRLLIGVKKFIASTSRFLLFEQNTATTRARFINTVNPYLESIQQRQGLYAFKVVMDETNNTPDVIDRNILAGQIFLQPAKAVEFIVIDFNILPTVGASFSA